MALKKALNDADLFVADNSKPTHRDSKTDTNDIIDYIISSPAIYNNIQNLTLKAIFLPIILPSYLISQQNSTKLLRLL